MLKWKKLEDLNKFEMSVTIILRGKLTEKAKNTNGYTFLHENYMYRIVSNTLEDTIKAFKSFGYDEYVHIEEFHGKPI